MATAVYDILSIPYGCKKTILSYLILIIYAYLALISHFLIPVGVIL